MDYEPSQEKEIILLAADGYHGLPNREQETMVKSLTLLKAESQLFDEAMILQLAVLRMVSIKSPITDDGLRAAIALGCWVFDQLRDSWLALLKGYYAVAFHNWRDVEQASITQQAVTLDDAVAKRFWEGKLDDGDAAKAVQKAMEKENPSYAANWAIRREALRKIAHRFTHPGRTAAGLTVLILPDQSGAVPVVGGSFVTERCLIVGRFCVNLAVSALGQGMFAFRSVLLDGGQLEQRFRSLSAKAEPIFAEWAQELETIESSVEQT